MAIHHDLAEANKLFDFSIDSLRPHIGEINELTRNTLLNGQQEFTQHEMTLLIGCAQAVVLWVVMVNIRLRMDQSETN